VDAVVSEADGSWYFDFPAEMKMEGEIKGEMYMIEIVDGSPVITETYKMELEFWNLESAGGGFSPEEDVLLILAEMTLPLIPEVTCLDYKLELENFENDEELKMSGEGYYIVAGLIEMGDAWCEAFIMIIEMEGDLFTILFSEQPGLDPIIEAEVTLDV